MSVATAQDRRYYVYLIYHDGKCIYVGKGTGSRCMQHLQREDMRHINDLSIRVVYVDDELAALGAEAGLIDAMLKAGEPLLNKHRPVPPQSWRWRDDIPAETSLDVSFIDEWRERIDAVIGVATGTHKSPWLARWHIRLHNLKTLRDELESSIGCESPVEWVIIKQTIDFSIRQQRQQILSNASQGVADNCVSDFLAAIHAASLMRLDDVTGGKEGIYESALCLTRGASHMNVHGALKVWAHYRSRRAAYRNGDDVYDMNAVYPAWVWRLYRFLLKRTGISFNGDGG